MGWTVLIDQTAGDADRERRLATGPTSHMVDGLIFSPWALTPEELSGRANRIPMVLIGERGAGGPLDHVAIDNVAAAAEATDHLLTVGRRRIAAIGPQPHLRNDTSQQRLIGFRRALRGAGMTVDPASEIPVRSLHRADGAAAMAELLQRTDPPDAVFCFTDELALGAVRTLADHGLRAPDDVALVGFDDIQDGRYSVPTLTTISPDKEQIAQACLDDLAARLRDADRPPSTTVAPHRLIVRQSTGG
jgi:DNA-binding LacI/PurR family transcriptional regulator